MRIVGRDGLPRWQWGKVPVYHVNGVAVRGSLGQRALPCGLVPDYFQKRIKEMAEIFE